jgi:hypothetical protein
VNKVVPLGPLVKRGRWPKRNWDDALLVPIVGVDNKVSTVEAINEDGKKDFLKGGKKRGGFFPFGRDLEYLRNAERVLVGEGIATVAVAIHATELPAIAAMDAGNLKHAATAVKELAPDAELIFLADNDIAPDRKNTGIEAATEAARSLRGKIAVPELDGQKCDFWDLWKARGPLAVRQAIEGAKTPLEEMAKDQVDDPIESALKASGLAALEPGASMTAVGKAVRGLASTLTDADGIDLALVREAALKKLEAIGLSAPARLLDARVPDGNEEKKGSSKRATGPSQADILTRFVEDSGAELFHTPTADTYISFPVNDHIETWATNSQATRLWLQHAYFRLTKKVVNNEALKAVVGLLESRARFEGKTSDVHLRTALHQGALFYDLCDSRWRAVRVDRDGWKIVEKSEIKFIRYSHMAAQVVPEPGGDIDKLFDFVNIDIKSYLGRLIKKFVPVALIPDIPRPCLALYGDQGSGKSTTARRLRALIDPSHVPMLRCKDECEIMQGLQHHFCPVVDNLSYLPVWLSDTFSRAITGEGFTKRRLYTDSDDFLFSFKRVLIITCIELVIEKSDLLDRSIIVALEQIPDDKRCDEALLDQEFEAARPKLFGAVLDILSGAIRERQNVKAATLPRMADFAMWGRAAVLGQAGNTDEFAKDFATNVARQNEEAIGASDVAKVLLAFLGDRKEWRGQPHELYATLKKKADEMKIPAKSFPRSVSIMGRKLRQIRPNLAAIGWKIEFGEGHRRQITIARKVPENDAPDAPPRKDEENQEKNGRGTRDDDANGAAPQNNDAHENPNDFNDESATRATHAISPPFSGARAVDDDGFNWDTGEQEHSPDRAVVRKS